MVTGEVVSLIFPHILPSSVNSGSQSVSSSNMSSSSLSNSLILNIHDFTQNNHLLPHKLRLRGNIFLVNCSMAIIGKYVLMEDDEVLDELIDHVLVDDLISVWRDGDQGGTKTDSQVVRVHHVLIT